MLYRVAGKFVDGRAFSYRADAASATEAVAATQKAIQGEDEKTPIAQLTAKPFGSKAALYIGEKAATPKPRKAK